MVESMLLTIDEAAELIGVSRPTFAKMREQWGLSEIAVGRRVRFLRSEILAKLKGEHLPVSDHSCPASFNIFSKSSIETVKLDEVTFDLRGLNDIDPYGVLSLFSEILAVSKSHPTIHLVVEDNYVCKYFQSIGFFYELERTCGEKIKWNRNALQGAKMEDASTLFPITLIRFKGGERILGERLNAALIKQGLSEEIGQYLTWMLGELADNSLTHSKQIVSERACYIFAKRSLLDERQCVILGIADTGVGISHSLKSNLRYRLLDDKTALLTAFRPRVSSWDDHFKRGKGLTDILKIAMGNASVLRADSGDSGFFFDFRDQTRQVRVTPPLTKVAGTRFGLVLIDSHFQPKERDEIDLFLSEEIAKL